MEDSADDAFLRPRTANSAWSSSRRGSNHSQYSTSPGLSIEGFSPYDPSQYEDLAHPSFMIGGSDIPMVPPNESMPLNGFSSNNTGRLLFPQSDPSLSPPSWPLDRRPSVISGSGTRGTGMQQYEHYSSAAMQQSPQLLPSRSDSILESDTYRMLFGPYDDRLQQAQSSAQRAPSPRYDRSGTRTVIPPSPSAFRLPPSSSSSSSSSLSSFATQQTSSYSAGGFVDPTVLTLPGASAASTSTFNGLPSTTRSRSAVTRQRSNRELGAYRAPSQPLPTSTVSPFSTFSAPTSTFNSPDLFENINPVSHSASYPQSSHSTRLDSHQHHAAYPSPLSNPLPLFPETGGRSSLNRRSSHSDLSAPPLQNQSSYRPGAGHGPPRRNPADSMSHSKRRYGTVTGANMRGLYTPESVDAAYPGEWGLAFR